MTNRDFAKINSDGTVANIIAVNDKTADEFIALLDGNYVETFSESLDNPRGNSARRDGIYDKINDKFINPKEYFTYYLDENFKWQPPKPTQFIDTQLDSGFIPIDKLDKSIHYVIVGVRKSGTTALFNYMLSLGFMVRKSEFSFQNVNDAESWDYSNFTPIIIVRNPIERAWTDYNTLGHFNMKEGCDNSYYKSGLQMWNALIYSLEDLSRLPDFPHLNQSNKPSITPEIKDRILIELLPDSSLK